MKNSWGSKALLLAVGSVPFAFLSVYADASSGSVLFYIVMIAGFSFLCRRAIKTNNLAILYLSNALSFASSYITATLSGLEDMAYYFKPFTAYSLIVIISVAAIIIQTIVCLVHIVKTKLRKDGSNPPF